MAQARRPPIYVAFDRLPGVVRARLAQSLALEAPPLPIRQRVDDSIEVFVLALVPVALGLAMVMWRLLTMRWWPAATSALFWTVATALVLPPLAFVAAVISRRRSLPFPEGKYVLATDLVVTSGADLAIYDLRDLVLNNIQWIGPGTWTSSEEKGRTVELASADDPLLFVLDASVDLDAAREIADAQAAVQTGRVPVELDLFRELRGEDRRIQLSRLAGTGEGPRATPVPALVRWGWALGLAIALAAGAAAFALTPPMPGYDDLVAPY